jgi:TetR/AcrR family transcriptional regulator, cholesterol catabolism regulator
VSRLPQHADPDRPARAAIVNVAARLFGEKGYHGTSVRDISNGVGILAGSLYSHISSKQELLAEILRGYSSRARAVLEPLEASSLSTREQLRQVFAVYFEITAEAPSQARVAVHDFRSLAPDELEVSRQRRRDTQAIVTRMLQQGIDRGEVRPIDPMLVTMAIFSIANWAVEWFDPAGAHTVEETAGFFADLIIDGIGSDSQHSTEQLDERHDHGTDD